MKPFQAYHFLQARGFLRHFAIFHLPEFRALSETTGTAGDGMISLTDKEGISAIWTDLREQFAELEFVASVASIDRLLGHLAKDDATHEVFYAISEELDGRLMDEIKKRHFMSLTFTETEQFRNPTKGWGEVIGRFPAALGDIEEAYKCFALSRYPASVFHSLQIVEIGLIELGRVVGAADHQTGWNATIAKLKKIVGTEFKARTDFQRVNWEFIEQLHGASEALKTAWRNKVSHAQGKLTLLTPDFTPDIAEEILYATRAFMRRLAVDLPTSPDPDA
jgi:hypothetical protein